MKIVAASDSFKSTLTSKQISEIIEKAAEEISKEIIVEKAIIADGGEGTLDAFYHAAGKQRISVFVNDPFGKKISAEYCLLQDGTAVIESAKVIGFEYGKKRKPMEANSFGLGQLIADAMDKSCKKIIVGLGGTCTTDGGIGMASALGFSFFDKNHKKIAANPIGLQKIQTIEIQNVNQHLWNTEIIFATDVTNPLYGPEGAAYTFAGQKGATLEEIVTLDISLQNLSNVIKKLCDRNVQQIQGVGAAGGIPAVFLGYFNAKIVSGLDLLLNTLQFNQIIKDADLIITGEGCLDQQSLKGKVPLTIGDIGKKANCNVIAIVGEVDDELYSFYAKKLDGVFTINRKALTLKESMEKSKENYFYTVKNILTFYEKILSSKK